MSITRRTFGLGTLAVAGSAVAPQIMAAARPRVVVVGGGAGGGTVARYVAKAAKGEGSAKAAGGDAAPAGEN